MVKNFDIPPDISNSIQRLKSQITFLKNESTVLRAF